MLLSSLEKSLPSIYLMLSRIIFPFFTLSPLKAIISPSFLYLTYFVNSYPANLVTFAKSDSFLYSNCLFKLTPTNFEASFNISK